AESSEKIRAALSATEALLNFLRTTPVATTPRVHGELLSLISQLFGLFAVAEGTASALAAECDPFIHDIQEFEEGNVEPMSMVLEQLKERAQRSSDRLSTRVQELKSQRLSVQNEAESKMTGIRGLEKQLEELGDNVNGLYTQIEALEAEKNVLERK